MERKVITALLIGAALGAASASALTPAKPSMAAASLAAPTETPPWAAYHAAIPADQAPAEIPSTY